MQTKAHYQELDELLQNAIAATLCQLYSLSKTDVVKRILNISNPELIVTESADRGAQPLYFIFSEKGRNIFITVFGQYWKEAK